MTHIPRTLLITVLGTSLLFVPPILRAAEVEPAESGAPAVAPYTPGLTAKAVDVLFARPLAFVFAVAGGVLFVATSPVMYVTGNLEEARERFVAEPSALLRGPLGGGRFAFAHRGARST